MRHDKPSWSEQMQDGRTVCLVFTSKRHGDLSVNQDSETLTRRQRLIVDEQWSYLEQVHDTGVLHIEFPGQHQGEQGDALWTNNSEVPISIQVADCVPVALISSLGSLCLVHAGWKGLVRGVIDEAVDAMMQIGKRPTTAVIGPCIHPSSYAFGEREIDQVCNVFGESVRSKTQEGCLALNLPKTVEVALRNNGIEELVRFDECTSNSEKFWSYRLRKEEERQAVVGWIKSKEDYFE